MVVKVNCGDVFVLVWVHLMCVCGLESILINSTIAFYSQFKLLVAIHIAFPQKLVSTKVPSRRVTASVIDGTRTATTVAWSNFPVRINDKIWIKFCLNQWKKFFFTGQKWECWPINNTFACRTLLHTIHFDFFLNNPAAGPSFRIRWCNNGGHFIVEFALLQHFPSGRCYHSDEIDEQLAAFSSWNGLL